MEGFRGGIKGGEGGEGGGGEREEDKEVEDEGRNDMMKVVELYAKVKKTNSRKISRSRLRESVRKEKEYKGIQKNDTQQQP